MNPIRTGRAFVLLLPYALVVGGLFAAAKVAGAPGGTGAASQALGVAALGGVWAWLRARRDYR